MTRKVSLWAATLLTGASAITWAQTAGWATVGANVQISKQYAAVPHYENLAAGDPDHPGRLIACASLVDEDRAAAGPRCYVSFDDGLIWSASLTGEMGRAVGDPTMAYGRGDTLYFTNIVRPKENLSANIGVYRSVDGGKTWKHMGLFPFVDRQTLVVDRTNGRYAGRLYYSGSVSVRGVDGRDVSTLHLYTSKDGGVTFDHVQVSALEPGASLSSPSTSVVLSDGTLAFLTEHGLDRTASTKLQLTTSTDGGVSLNPPTTVAEWSRDFSKSQGGLFAQLAVDPGSAAFKDRLYAVWPDNAVGRIEIRFSFSADSGKTWSPPVVINDDRPPHDRDRGPDHMLPAVAVNRQGVVLVTWYDRRDIGDNMGWKIRAAASVDGGETFTPSVLISDTSSMFTDRTAWVLERQPRVVGGATLGARGAKGQPMSVDVALNDFFLTGGHTSGLAVGANDVFHAVWIDNRTGVPQFWTAPISVHGSVQRHGSAALAGLDDITDRVTFVVESNHYDRASNTLTLIARLKNMSKETLRGPIYLRMVTLTSQLGVARVVGADNDAAGAGGVWAFDNSALPPESMTMPQTFTFRLTEIRPLEPTKVRPNFTSGLVHFDVRVYGPARGRRP
jgi:hypothetical protein